MSEKLSQPPPLPLPHPDGDGEPIVGRLKSWSLGRFKEWLGVAREVVVVLGVGVGGVASTGCL